MGLELAGRTDPAVTTIEPLHFAPQGWWFWIKAGIGFTFGAGLITFLAVVLWWSTVIWFAGLSSLHR